MRGGDAMKPAWVRALIALCNGLGALSGLSILGMIGLICADVLLRLPFIGVSIVGSYDLVRVLGAVSLAAALPYTTAIKGHVAIEFFFHKLGKRARAAVDGLMRALSIALFGFIAWRCAGYGLDLLAANQVSQTLRLPLFWLPLFIGACAAVTGLVVVFHLTRPREELIKP
jgi:TRAP-type C4-dicarboxylate transport system permease small subunit